MQAGQPFRLGVGQRDHEGVGVVPLGEALQGDRGDFFVGHHLPLAGDGHRARHRRAPASHADRVGHVYALVEERAPEIVPKGVLGEHGREGHVQAEAGQGDGHVGYPAGRDAQVRRAHLGTRTGWDGQTRRTRGQSRPVPPRAPAGPGAPRRHFPAHHTGIGRYRGWMWSRFLRQQLIAVGFSGARHPQHEMLPSRPPGVRAAARLAPRQLPDGVGGSGWAKATKCTGSAPGARSSWSAPPR